jgi:hypothetical protein
MRWKGLTTKSVLVAARALGWGVPAGVWMPATAYLLVPAAAIGAGEARIRLSGPSAIEPGQAYDLFVQADNTGLSPEATRGIDWQVTGPDYIQWLSVVSPPSLDFFSNSS